MKDFINFYVSLLTIINHKILNIFGFEKLIKDFEVYTDFKDYNDFKVYNDFKDCNDFKGCIDFKDS